jgi:hypothetical protein
MFLIIIEIQLKLRAVMFGKRPGRSILKELVSQTTTEAKNDHERVISYPQ